MINLEDSINKVSELCGKLKQLLPYIKDKEIGKVVKWAEEDLNEIKELRRQIEENGLLEEGKKIKKNQSYNIKMRYDVEKNILEVYKLIERELEEWREIYLQQVKKQII